MPLEGEETMVKLETVRRDAPWTWLAQAWKT